jgi:hypothetical protein
VSWGGPEKAKEMGRKGGLARTARKKLSSKINARKGGRRPYVMLPCKQCAVPTLDREIYNRGPCCHYCSIGFGIPLRPRKI